MTSINGLRYWQRAARSSFVRLHDSPRGFWILSVTMLLGGATLMTFYVTLVLRAGAPELIPALFVVLIASTLSSIAGFAFSAICGAILLHFMSNPVRIVEIMMVSSIAIQSLSVAVLRRDIDWRSLMPFLAGGVVGLPVGVTLLFHLPATGFKHAIGALLMAYAGYSLLNDLQRSSCPRASWMA